MGLEGKPMAQRARLVVVTGISGSGRSTCLRALEDELFSGYDLTAQQYNALRLLRETFG